MSGISTYIFAFLVGGAFCLVAQILIDKTALTPARILVLYVCAGVLFGALGWYDPLKRLGGCGATLPLTGFGAAVASGVKKAVGEDGFLGIFRGRERRGACVWLSRSPYFQWQTQGINRRGVL